MGRLRRLAMTIVAAEPLFLLAALPFLVVLPLRLAPVGLGIMAVAWLARWLAYGRLSVRSSADWPLTLLALMAPVTLYATALPEVTWRSLAYLAAGLLTLNSLVNWLQNERRLWLAAWGLMAVGVALALAAPFSVEWFAEIKLLFIPEDLYRAMPLLLPDPIHPNVMAGALALILPLPLALLLLGSEGVVEGLPGSLRRPRLVRGGLAVSWLLMVAVLALTKSRGGCLATAAGMLVLLALWRRWTLLALPLGGAGVALAWSRLGGVGLADALFSTQAIGGWQGRQDIWSRALYMIQDFPFTGVGLGTFNQVANVMYPFFLAGPDADIPHAHNLFLQVAVDLGLPGIVAYLALWLSCLAVAWRAYIVLRRRPVLSGVEGERGLASLAAGLGTSLTVIGLHGLVDAVTWGTKPAVVAWAIMGMAVALHRYQTMSHRSPSPSHPS